jgi:hypothetical protein
MGFKINNTWMIKVKITEAHRVPLASSEGLKAILYVDTVETRRHISALAYSLL